MRRLWLKIVIITTTSVKTNESLLARKNGQGMRQAHERRAHAGGGKMALEATQSMYAALHVAGVQLDDDAYGLTHSRHRLVRWLASS